MALLATFLCYLLAAWLCDPSLGVPLAPSGRAPAVGEWIAIVHGTVEGASQVADGAWAAGHRTRPRWLLCGPRPDSKVAGTGSSQGSPVGEPIEQSAGRLFTSWVCVVLFPGEDSRSCCRMEKAAKNCCGYSLGHPVCPEHWGTDKIPTSGSY